MFRFTCRALLAALILLTPFTALTAGAETPAKPQQVDAGAYILRLMNVSPKDGSFEVDMWVWFRWQGNEIDPVNTFEIANGIITNREVLPTTLDGTTNYASARIQATIYQDFDVHRFPMDDHVLKIAIEDSVSIDADMQFRPDTGTSLDPAVSVAGWDVELLPPTVAPNRYDTDYGMHASGDAASSYSRLVIPVELTRTGYGPLFKSFWISLLSVVLGLLALLVKADDLDARFGMGVGSIFAASANSFVIADSLPPTTSVTLAEQINLIAVAVIFISVFVSIWSLRLRYKGRDEASLALDRNAMLVLGLIYIALNVFVLVIDLG